MTRLKCGHVLSMDLDVAQLMQLNHCDGVYMVITDMSYKGNKHTQQEEEVYQCRQNAVISFSFMFMLSAPFYFYINIQKYNV